VKHHDPRQTPHKMMSTGSSMKHKRKGRVGKRKGAHWKHDAWRAGGKQHKNTPVDRSFPSRGEKGSVIPSTGKKNDMGRRTHSRFLVERRKTWKRPTRWELITLRQSGCGSIPHCNDKGPETTKKELKRKSAADLTQGARHKKMCKKMGKCPQRLAPRRRNPGQRGREEVRTQGKKRGGGGKVDSSVRGSSTKERRLFGFNSETTQEKVPVGGEGIKRFTPFRSRQEK